jgi:hypothetical protein
MKKILVATALGLALAACSPTGAGKTAMVDSCVKEGQDKALCTCMVNEFEKNLDKETFAALTKAAASGQDVSDDFVQNMKPEQMASFMAATMAVGQKCSPA